MKVLERYILAEFAKLLSMAFVGFILLFIVVDVFENMDDLMENGVPLSRSVAFFAYKIPFIIGQVSPIAVLLSVLLSLGLLAKHNEMTAVKAGGLRLVRVLKPLFIAGVIISGGIMVMNETMTISGLKKAESFRAAWLEGIKGSYGRQGLWIKEDAGIFNIRHVDVRNGELRGVTFFRVEEDFSARQRVKAPLALWRDGRWVAPEATVWEFTRSGGVTASEGTDIELPGPREPAELTNVGAHDNMSFFELAAYVRSLEDDGYDSAKHRLDLYGKVTFPMVNFIMVLVGIPFALKTGRHSGIAAGVGLSVLIAFSYWVVYAITRSLGANGIMPPMVAALFPDVLFAAVGLLMYGFVRQ